MKSKIIRILISPVLLIGLSPFIIILWFLSITGICFYIIPFLIFIITDKLKADDGNMLMLLKVFTLIYFIGFYINFIKTGNIIINKSKKLC